MKLVYLLPVLLLFSGCETSILKWGYSNNPEAVLFSAQGAVKQLDVNLWGQVTQGYPYCKYGSKEGLSYLHQVLKFSSYKGIKLLKIISHRVRDAGDVVLRPHYTKIYKATLLDQQTLRESAFIFIKCQFKLSPADVKNDSLSTKDFQEAFCKISGVDLFDVKNFYKNQVCDKFLPDFSS